MKKILGLSLITIAYLQAGGDITPQVCQSDIKAPTSINSIADAFAQGKVSGQIRAGYIWVDPSSEAYPQNYTTAIGGQLKYETASYQGFSAGMAFYTSHAIMGLSGDRDEGKFNESLASDDKYYDLLGEAYINYSYESFNIRVGRQLIDTPYADSDDIRMTPNTFEGVVASYGIDDFTLLGAYLTKWQGPDAQYEFEDLIEDGDGVALLALTYAKNDLEASIWYYNADNTANIVYADISQNFELNSDTNIKLSAQFANQSQIDDSGVDGMLYGAMVELGYKGLSASIAYDKVAVDDDSSYFGGFGGGVGYVNMFEMTAGALAAFEDIDAWKYSIGYDFASVGCDGLSMSFDYGDFDGENNHEAKEYNFTLAYAPSKTWDVEVVYDKIDDVHKNLAEDDATHAPIDFSLDRVLVRANYNF